MKRSKLTRTCTIKANASSNSRLHTHPSPPNRAADMLILPLQFHSGLVTLHDTDSFLTIKRKKITKKTSWVRWTHSAQYNLKRQPQQIFVVDKHRTDQFVWNSSKRSGYHAFRNTLHPQPSSESFLGQMLKCTEPSYPSHSVLICQLLPLSLLVWTSRSPIGIVEEKPVQPVPE